MNKKRILGVVLLLLVGGCSPNDSEQSANAENGAVPGKPVGAQDSERQCQSLVGKTFGDATIVQATAQPADAPVAGTVVKPPMPTGPGEPVSGLPAFCRVVGEINPEPGSNIGFEVWLPETDWDGRLYGAGNGGYAGDIHYRDLATAIMAGQAAVSTNTGHEGYYGDGSWAKDNPVAIRDFAWRGIHLANVAARAIITDYFGRAPEYAYFVSCSGGGRQALMEAARFPDDYDGIIAGAPAARWTELIMSMIWHAQAQLPEGASIRGEQAALIQQEMLKQCDAADGQRDGLVANPLECDVDISTLACGVNSSPQCFSQPQLTALEKIIEGPPRNAIGQSQGWGFPLAGAEMGAPLPFLGWDGWIFGRDGIPPSGRVLAEQSLEYFMGESFTDIAGFDFNKHPQMLHKQWGDELDARPDLSKFFSGGGKLILWHGWADAAISPLMTLDFYDNILQKSGSGAEQSLQLFMVPGMQHCFAGTGAGDFGQESSPLPGDTPENDMVKALQSWVENGRVPKSLVGRVQTASELLGAGKGEAKERLVCAYPQKAVLSDGADPEKASSYRCQ